MRRLPSRMDFADTDKNLTVAKAWIEHSGVHELLVPYQPERGLAGRKIERGQYLLSGMLIALAEICMAGREMSWRELTYTLWYRYTDAQMEFIEMSDLRDPERKALMASFGNHVDSPDVNLAKRAWHTENERCRQAFSRVFAAIDDNVLPGGKCHTNAEVAEAKRTVDVTAQTALREEVLNRLVMGSVITGNAMRFKDLDPKDIYAGVLKDHVGDFAIDETEVDESLSAVKNASKPSGKHPANEMSKFHKHSRRIEWPNLIGLTLAIAVSRPGRPRVPNLALGMSMHDPSAANKAGAYKAVGAIEDAGMRRPMRSNAKQYIIADLAYPNLLGFNAGLTAMKYSLVMKYKKNQKRVHELATAHDDDGSAVPGHLFNGVCVCPGLPRAALNKMRLNPPEPIPLNGQDRDRFDSDEDPDLRYDPVELDAHDKKVALLAAATMPRHGRPESKVDRRAGRPLKNIEYDETIHTVRVVCPAVAGKIRCPLVAESMSLDVDTPQISGPPPGKRPAVCERSYTTIRMNAKRFKHYQELMMGTWEHEDLYTSARARNEAFHSLLIRHSGGNMIRGRIKPHKNAFYTMAIALSVGVTNLRVLEAWEETLALNGRVAPEEPHKKKQIVRKNILKRYRNK